jgi:hypothetical protein
MKENGKYVQHKDPSPYIGLTWRDLQRIPIPCHVSTRRARAGNSSRHKMRLRPVRWDAGNDGWEDFFALREPRSCVGKRYAHTQEPNQTDSTSSFRTIRPGLHERLRWCQDGGCLETAAPVWTSFLSLGQAVSGAGVGLLISRVIKVARS